MPISRLHPHDTLFTRGTGVTTFVYATFKISAALVAFQGFGNILHQERCLIEGFRAANERDKEDAAFVQQLNIAKLDRNQTQTQR